MLNQPANPKIYLCTGLTDMRKGVNSLSILAESVCSEQACSGAMVIFRGRRADKIKILWSYARILCMASVGEFCSSTAISLFSAIPSINLTKSITSANIFCPYNFFQFFSASLINL